MKRRKRATYGSGPLSRPSMPAFPGWPSRNNLKKWSRTRSEAEQQGIQLLIEHYASQSGSVSDFQLVRSLLERRSIAAPSLETEAEQLRALVLALATDHVPFFSPKRTKRTAIDVYVLAQLLKRYQEELNKGRSAREARSKAKVTKGLCDKLAGVSDRRIQNLLSQARTAFKALVTLGPEGAITPVGDLERRIWQNLTRAESLNENAHVTVEWSSADPDSVVVFGL